MEDPNVLEESDANRPGIRQRVFAALMSRVGTLDQVFHKNSHYLIQLQLGLG